MKKFGIGQPILRKEDIRFITGKGLYTGDITFENQSYMYVLRSNVAHGRIINIDIEKAKKEEGVLNVFLAQDLEKAGINALGTNFKAKNKDGSEMFTPKRIAIAKDKVRHVGDPIAVVIAESVELAKNASEMIVVDIEELSSNTITSEAHKNNSPIIWDEAKNNICFDWDMGDKNKVEEVFAKADKIIELDLTNNRIVPNPMEARGVVACYDPKEEKYELRCSSQGVHSLRARISEVMGIEEEKMRVITTDVGGGFGMKIFNFPEYICALFASKLTERPVKWIAERSESFLSDTHGRDHVTTAKLALNNEGVFLGCLDLARLHV